MTSIPAGAYPATYRGPMHLERQLEDHFRKQITMAGGRTIKLAPTEQGTPDRMVILPPGEIFLVELKAEKGRLSEIQRFWHEQVAELGIVVYTLYGRAEIDAWITWARNEMFEKHDALEDLKRQRERRTRTELRREQKGRR